MEISTKVKNLKNELNNRLNELEKIESYLFRTLCLFSIAEQYAQDSANYNGLNGDIFKNFLLNYSNNDDVTKIDPVTLYYHYKETPQLSSYVLKFDADNIPILASEPTIQQETEKIEACLNNNSYEQHTYAALIYRYRCKLSHELHSPSILWDDEQTINEPFYGYVHQLSCDSDNVSGYWELRFPYTYLKNLFYDSINSYLDNCISTEKRPFESMKDYLSWYE